MKADDSKHIVQEFYRHFGRADVDGMAAMLGDDLEWWVLSKPHLFSLAGTRKKPEMLQLWESIFELLDGPMTMDIVGLVVEDDKVAVELRSHATTKAGKIYENDYHMLFAIRGGQIVKAREYTDLLYINDVFGSHGPRTNIDERTAETAVTDRERTSR